MDTKQSSEVFKEEDKEEEEEEESIDFGVSKIATSLHNIADKSLGHSMVPSPVSSRLNLQASIDGEISTNSESSGSGS